MTPFALYIHIPFCRSRCSYCDFNTYLYDLALAKTYVAALLKEARRQAASLTPEGYYPQTLYFGGGTPSVLPLRLLAQILEEMQRIFSFPPSCEMTLEANPKTLSKTKLSCLKKSGINRLSLGVQSFDEALLATLGRAHTAQEARAAFYLAKEEGFTDINLDFIFGIPGQSLPLWENTLKEAVKLSPTHLSIYGLTLEPQTPLKQRLLRGEITLPPAEEEAEMFLFAHEFLRARGYQHYEISNYARPAYQSRHNWFYWRHQEYLGLGAGAYSYIKGRRFSNDLHPRDYVKRIEEKNSAVVFCEDIDQKKALEENLMLALRTQEGMIFETFKERFGRDPQTLWAGILKDLAAGGLLEITDKKVFLTPQGWWTADEITARLLAFLP